MEIHDIMTRPAAAWSPGASAQRPWWLGAWPRPFLAREPRDPR
jgi:hypothetical protein